jgi:SagB-type dehydrogenase family enzyme
MKRLRHDLNYLTSAGLLVAVLAAAFTGIVAHLWDLNDFWYHTYASYVMLVFAIAHVWLNWSRMLAYARFRFSGKRRERQIADMPAAERPARPPSAVSAAGVAQPEPSVLRMAVSRRSVLGLSLGGIGGYVLGRGLRQPPPIAAGSDLGVVYHQWSKPGVIDVLGTVANWGQQPPLYKTYPGVPQIVLPQARLEGGLTTEEAITRRRSTRAYSGAALSMHELSRLLLLMGGINAERWGHQLRTAPSSGALFPIEAYPVVHNVEGLSPGVYHYGVKDHSLAQLRAADLREQVVQQGLMQEFLGQCNVVIFLTIILQRMRFKYQDRSYRYGLIEAGHLGQNIYLAATSMGLGACAIGAFMDDAINQMLGVDGVEEAAVYMLAVGKV